MECGPPGVRGSDIQGLLAAGINPVEAAVLRSRFSRGFEL